MVGEGGGGDDDDCDYYLDVVVVGVVCGGDVVAVVAFDCDYCIRYCYGELNNYACCVVVVHVHFVICCDGVNYY